MSVNACLACLRRPGLLMKADTRPPSVATLLADEAVGGSWWAHPLDDLPPGRHAQQTLEAIWPGAGWPWQVSSKLNMRCCRCATARRPPPASRMRFAVSRTARSRGSPSSASVPRVPPRLSHSSPATSPPSPATRWTPQNRHVRRQMRPARGANWSLPPCTISRSFPRTRSRA